MKRTAIILLALLAITLQGMAQSKYLNIYQGRSVVGSISTVDVDSVSITGSGASRQLNFYRGDYLVKNYTVASVDSIKVASIYDDPWVYLGIIGFNSGLQEKPLDILAPSTRYFYTNFANNLTMADGTVLYHAVDKALDNLTASAFRTPVKNVYLITFTDGLDQGSLMLTDRYDTEREYLTAVNRRIRNTTVQGMPLIAYSIGLKGSDVGNDVLFRENLTKLASSQANVAEPTTMADVEQKLRDLANQIISANNSQHISIRIPGQGNGTRVRFTFDGEDATTSSVYIDGTFSLRDRSLKSVSFHGLTGTLEQTVQGVQDGIFVTFAFDEMRRADGNGLINVGGLRHFNLPSGTSVWQENSESSNATTTTTHYGTIVMLNLDCSRSMADGFYSMKQYATDFINMLTATAEDLAIATPQDVKAALNSDFKLEVQWSTSKYAESYTVYRSTSSTGSFTQVASGVTSNSWTDENVQNNTTYYYKVQAFGHGLSSGQSSASSGVRVFLPAPENVASELILNGSGFAVKVTWNAVSLAESYLVYRSGSSTGTFTQVAEGIRAATWIDRSPLEGMNFYKVVAVGHGLTSSQSNVSNGINYALDAPAKVKAVINANNGTVDVSWDAVSLAESYTVYRSGSSTGEFTKVAENVTATTWTDTAPLAGRNYYKVQASGHGLESPMSNVAMVLKPLPNDGVITVNGVQFKMIKVSGGTFQMGQSADGNNVTPVHSVTLSDYYIGETEVTQELWEAVMGSNPSKFKGAKRPVEYVTWNDCQTFITKLNALTGQDFRLPTEAEWEFAAKGGTQSKGYTYSGSNTIGDVAWYTSNSGSQTHDVATKAPNELGIYDMSGNVWEWCQDWYGSYSSSSQTNPTGPSSGSRRVDRGGCWGDYAGGCCRAAYRDYYYPTDGSLYIGLRLAL